MHIGALALFNPTQPVHPGRLVKLIADRARQVPRLKRRIHIGWWPPGAASWVDDPDFSGDHHVFGHHLHRAHTADVVPVDRDRLLDRVSTLMAQQLDLARPPWQIHVITGLGGGRFGVLVKLHHALADGLGAVELGMRLLDGCQGDPAAPPASGRPTAKSTPRTGHTLDPLGMLGEAIAAAAAAPRIVRQAGQVLGIAGSAIGGALRPSPPSPLATTSSGERGVALAKLDLREVKQVRRYHGGTVNDLLLAVVCGALREWLTARGDRLGELPVRALIPVSRRHRSTGGAGNRLSGYLCDLPIAEPDPHRRLAAIRASMDRNKAAGPHRGPGAIAVLAERLPPAVHRVATPIAGLAAPLLFDTVITSVPLPGLPLTLDGAQLREVYPLAPLAPYHALGVALSTYRDAVHIGLQADRRAMPDLQGLGEAIPRALWALAPDVTWPVASSAAR